MLVLARLAFVVAHQPLAGFANQYDMLHTTTCFGLVPDIEAPDGAPTPWAPVTRYRTTVTGHAGCLISTEAGLASLSLGIKLLGDVLGITDSRYVPLRLFAWTKSTLLLLALAYIDHRLRGHNSARLAHGCFAALIIVDPFNSLYLASFYSEFSALLAAYLGTMLPIIWSLGDRAPSRSAILAWGAALAALALSRMQHVALPFAFLAWAAILAREPHGTTRRKLALALIPLIPAIALQIETRHHDPTVTAANRWDSLFGAVLPAASDPSDLAKSLGLPADCERLVYTTWYLRRSHDARAECPDAFRLPLLRWAAQLAERPTTFATLVSRGVSMSGQWRPGYLGEIAGGHGERMQPGQLGLGASFASAVARVPYFGLLALWSWPLLASSLRPIRSLVHLLIRGTEENRGRLETLMGRRDTDASSERCGAREIAHWIQPMLATIVLLGWTTALLGDGYSELARHLHLAANAALTSALLSCFQLVRHAQRLGRHELASDCWSLAIVATAALSISVWVDKQALAVGVLEKPASDGPQETIVLSGWALDPRGIAQVNAVWADGQREPLSTYSREDLRATFGTGVGRHGIGFTGPVGRHNWRSGDLAIEVIPNRGSSSIIGRLWLK